MSEIIIRPGTCDDVPLLWPWVQKAVTKMNAEGSDQWGPDYPLPKDYLGDAQRGELLVATTAQGRIVGVCCVTLIHEDAYDSVTFQQGDPAGVIHRMAIDPSLHRQGIARILFRAAEAQAKARGALSMHLDTYSLNLRMQAMFQAEGYEKRGEISLHGRPNRFIVVEKSLD